jgi:hypothetical protein
VSHILTLFVEYCGLVTIFITATDAGWTWYGGVAGAKVANVDTAPGTLSDFGLYWACSWIEIKGGTPLAAEYTPVFVNDMSQFSDEGCAASVNTVTGCIVEPCSPVIDAKFMKPAEFENGKTPPPLTPQMYGATSSGGTTPPTVTESTKPTEPITESTKPTEPMTKSTKPTEPMTESTKPTQPMTESTKPTEPMTESTRPTEPLTESTKPNEPITETTEPITETTEPTEPMTTGDLYLQIFTAMLDYEQREEGPVLTDGMSVCPRDYPNGISVWCMGVDQETTSFVTLFVDGVEKRKENHFPYAISSDDGNGRSWPWRPRKGSHTIKCKTDTGVAVEVSINISCYGNY